MVKYQKIQSLYLRDENNIIIPGAYACPEFEYLENTGWEATEKVDGTNTSADISFDGERLSVEFHGRTENAQIPGQLVSRLREVFTAEAAGRAFAKQFAGATPEKPFSVQVFGEGYGARIQKGGNYIPDGVDFILFDVHCDGWWLSREACESVADGLGVGIVPLIGMMTIPEAAEYVKKGFKSTIAANPDYDAEGLVLKTPCGLKARNGERIVAKVKTVDFQKYRNKYGDGPVKQTPNPKYQKQ